MYQSDEKGANKIENAHLTKVDLLYRQQNYFTSERKNRLNVQGCCRSKMDDMYIYGYNSKTIQEQTHPR
jgi:hypothetical protein